MAKEINDIDELIGKVLAGEATAEEKESLMAWASSSDENSGYLEDLKTIFTKASLEEVQHKFDADAAWNKVRQRLRESKERTNRFKIFLHIPTTIRIAAGVLFILGSGFLAYQWFSPAPEIYSVVTDKSTVQDTLPDGSRAFLNKRSSIGYEYNPRENLRKVKLKGEGFFEINHQAEKSFVLSAEDVLVLDIGTAFNVKAYPESDTVEVVVKSGEVQIYTLNNTGLRLTAGESGIYRKSMTQFYRIEKTDTNVLSYKTGILSFNNTYLKTIIEKVNEIYGSQIRLDSPAIASCRLTVNFHGDSIDTIIEVIAETLHLTVVRKKDEIILTGAGCN